MGCAFDTFECCEGIQASLSEGVKCNILAMFRTPERSFYIVLCAATVPGEVRRWVLPIHCVM
jgi:hypothetical protein